MFMACASATTVAPSGMSGSPLQTQGWVPVPTAPQDLFLPVLGSARRNPVPAPSTSPPTVPVTTTPTTTTTTTTTTPPPSTTTTAVEAQRRPAPRPASEWRPLVSVWFRSEDVDRVLDIIACESSGDPNAYNDTPTPNGHATGLLQHLDGFWADRAAKADRAGFHNHGDIWDPTDQMAVSAYLAYATPQGFGHWVCNP